MAKSKYEKDFPERVKAMAETGMIEKDMAANLGISVPTFEQYKKKYVKFSKSLKDGKKVPDDMVESALFRRAMGYEHPDVHISNYQGVITITDIVKHYPPDATSMIFWLKNRRPETWREKTEIEHSDKVDNFKIDKELEQLSTEDLRIMIDEKKPKPKGRKVK